MDEHLGKIVRELEATTIGKSEGEKVLFEEEELARLSTLLPRYNVAHPTAAQTSALLARMHAMLPVQAEPRFAEQLAEAAAMPLRRSLQTMERLSLWFWLSAIAAVGISMLFIKPFAQAGLFVSTNPVLLLAPLLMFLSIAYACRTYGTPVYELELSLPVTPAQWMMRKLVFVLAAHIVLFSVASLALTWNDLSALLPFTISWLVPLCLYSALLLTLMIHLGTMPASILMSLLWLVQVIAGDHLGYLYWLGDQHYAYWAQSKLLGMLLTLLASMYIGWRLKLEREKVAGGLGARMRGRHG